jgi:hypothetical protein
MPEYTLSTGEPFQTILIPKGTVLFRGNDLHTDKPHPEYLFTDLFGSPDEDGYYCTDPHQNKVFYPAPFISDSVNRYAVHGIFITNYDIEVVSMVRPSLLSRDKSGPIYTRCSELSEKDSCGQTRKSYDPCLSTQLLREYPHIQGYIAIAEKDARIFQKGQFPSFMKDVPEAIEYVKPFIVSDSRNLQSVPEIVLFPYHSRPATIFDKIAIHPRSVEPNYINWAIKNRAALNYFPLLYITETNLYSFKELVDDTKLFKLASTEREDPNFDSPITRNMIRFLSNALNRGFFIGSMPFKFTVDMRTGFYIIDIPDVKKLNYTIKRMNISLSHDLDPKIVPFHYPLEYKKKLHSAFTKSSIVEEELEKNLNHLYASYSKHYQFNKGDPTKFKTVYKMNVSIPRPDLTAPLKRFTQKRKR